MVRSKVVSLRQCFSVVRDPRRDHQRFHDLWDIIAITICAVLAGADCWPDVAEYGRCKQEWLESFLELPHGIPSHDTFARVFALLDPSAFQEGFRNWVQALVETTEGRVVAIDGKTLRHSFDNAKGKGALHLVGAWAAENNLMLGQQAVDCKSNEITAIPKLLEILDLTGAIVTIDAMGCQKEIAAKIIAKESDYVLALKGNQENLYNDVEKLCERQVGDATPTVERRFYISSIDAKVKTFARAVRGHWGIENKLHWVLDVSFHEDASRLRSGHGPENLALVRRLAVSLLQKDRTAKQGIAGKRKKSGWDDAYLLRVLGRAMV